MSNKNVKTVGWYFSLIALIAAVVSLAVYVIRGGNEYSAVEQPVMAIMAIAIVINAAMLINDFELGAFIPFILYTVVLGILLNTEMLFISNVLTGIDGNVFDGMFFVFMGALVVSIVCGCVAFVGGMKKSK